jgi:glucosylceramidase
MKHPWLKTLLAIVCSFLAGDGYAQDKAQAVLWRTLPDRSALFESQMEGAPMLDAAPKGSAIIAVNVAEKYQTMDGFGFALTGGSAVHLAAMSPSARAALLKELFTTEGIGISYLRVSIGASDLNDHVFTYDDLPAGETDLEMAKFSLNPDRGDVIPMLKQILALDPNIKILASPWTAPVWMKTSQKAKGGKLKPEYYSAYAKYFVKYLEGMRAEGIRIDALTIQNEPLNEGNTPSLKMLASEQADFIKNHLGPAFKAAGITTKIVLYDHNCDVPEYAAEILKDAAASPYVDGSGFHLYRGEIGALSRVHDAFPEKRLYFTEQMVIERPGQNNIEIDNPVAQIVIGATRNWSRNVLLWNLAADADNNPHTDDGGCTMCQGAVTIEGDKVTRNLAYYTIAHAAKHVRPGSVRIGSAELSGLPNVAFLTPDGRKAAILANQTPANQDICFLASGKYVAVSLPSRAVVTCVWP